ncbi:PilZ domain-containing protein [Robertmurraya massiliosenegalensis]|uniref:PilZ domain-containing protein n=1 Tax=Robertmurraya TaxID=2837507 RepID=UPI0039A457CB
MRFKRKSAFRYTFEQPILAHFRIVKIDEKVVKTHEGMARILDISPRGLKINSELNIPETDYKTIELSLRFPLNTSEFSCNGIIKWKKEMGTTVDYGIGLLVDEFGRKSIIEQLKIHSKNTDYHDEG